MCRSLGALPGRARRWLHAQFRHAERPGADHVLHRRPAEAFDQVGEVLRRARAIRQERFTAKELAKQIQAMAQHPEALANAAHAAWNCGRPRAAEDLADLVESFGGAPMQDVIRTRPLNVSELGMQASTGSACDAHASEGTGR